MTPVQAEVGKDAFAALALRWHAFAAPCSHSAADFKQIDEVDFEAQRQLEAHRLESVVAESDMFVARAFPQQLGAKDVDLALGQNDLPVHHQIGIHQLDDQEIRTLLDCRTKK